MAATWIRQGYPGPDGNDEPFVMGSRWMLEMHRSDNGSRSFRLFLAAFGIIRFFDAHMTRSEFVGLSRPGHHLEIG